MFKELFDVTKECAISIIVTRAGEGLLRVNVIPKPIGENANPALSTPICVEATPEELDEKFGGVLTGFTTARQSLQESLDAAKATMEAAGKVAAEEAAAKAKKSATKPKTTASASESPAAPEAPQVPAAVAAAESPSDGAPAEENLFG